MHCPLNFFFKYNHSGRIECVYIAFNRILIVVTGSLQSQTRDFSSKINANLLLTLLKNIENIENHKKTCSAFSL